VPCRLPGVFLRDGFHGASLAAIAEEAGYTFGAVHSNFEDKDDLARAPDR
jgi:AcrR family transcriptional regulator